MEIGRWEQVEQKVRYKCRYHIKLITSWLWVRSQKQVSCVQKTSIICVYDFIVCTISKILILNWFPTHLSFSYRDKLLAFVSYSTFLPLILLVRCHMLQNWCTNHRQLPHVLVGSSSLCLLLSLWPLTALNYLLLTIYSLFVFISINCVELSLPS